VGGCTQVASVTGIIVNRCTTVSFDVDQPAVVPVNDPYVVIEGALPVHGTALLPLPLAVLSLSAMLATHPITSTFSSARKITLTGTFPIIDGIDPAMSLTDTVGAIIDRVGCSSTHHPRVEICTGLIYEIAQSATLTNRLTNLTLTHSKLDASCDVYEPFFIALLGPPQMTAVGPHLVCDNHATVTLTVEGANFLLSTSALASAFQPKPFVFIASPSAMPLDFPASAPLRISDIKVTMLNCDNGTILAKVAAGYSLCNTMVNACTQVK
jgi:hypothetical protein